MTNKFLNVNLERNLFKVKKICVIGLGYVGLPTAILLAENFKVIGIDINKDVVNAVSAGKLHFKEDGLEEKLKSVVKNKNLFASLEAAEADFFLITVPTPITKSNEPDMSFVFNAVEKILPFLKKGNTIIIESTSPVGATESIAKLISEKRKDLNITKDNSSDIFFAYSPERILPGQIIHELENNNRTVGLYNGENRIAEIKEIYNSFCKGTITFTDDKTAEMSKLVENSFRDVQIAFANEISFLAEVNNVNVHELINLVNQHPRVNVLNPGTGVGGHCIPIDPYFLTYNNPNLKLLKTAREINENRPIYIVEKIKTLLGNKKKIGILGLSYKKDVDDFRTTPAEIIIKLLKADGKEVLANDIFEDRAKLFLENLDLKFYSIEDVLNNSDVILINTPHTHYKDLFKNIREKVVINPSGF